MIGCSETKLAYFNKGLIEVIIPLIADSYDPALTTEILTILNCFTYDFPKAIEIFGHFKLDLISALTKIINNESYYEKLTISAFRLLRSLLQSEVVKASDFATTSVPLINKLGFCLSQNSSNISLVAELISMLCAEPKLRQSVGSEGAIDSLL